MSDDNISTCGALAGLRVVDLTRVLGGPYCTQILADHGADVIKVEPPSGDETRDWGPPFRNGMSAYFAGINRNKRAIALDLSLPEGREVLLRLLETADVLIENFKPGTLERWGLAYETSLAARFPRLIHCSVTGFGATGPLGGFPGYDAMMQGWSGLMSVTGSPESGPTRLGIPLIDMATGLNAVIGILMAYIECQRSGRGQSIDLALYDVGVALQHPHAPGWFMSSKTPVPTGNSHPSISPYAMLPTRTRPIVIGAGNDRQFRMLCAELGRPDLSEQEQFRTNKDRVVHRAALDAILRDLLADVDGEAFAVALMRAGVPAGAVLEVPDVLTHAHTLHREMVVSAEDGSDYRGTGIPIKLSRTPGRARTAPPAFAADNEAVLAAAGIGDEERRQLIETGAVLQGRTRL